MPTPIGPWLRAARLAQTNPDTGRPWSQEYAAERVTSETGRKLYRETLNGYERGKGMEPATLEWLVGFWQRYGVEAPDLTPEQPELSFEKQQLALLLRQVEAQERQANAMELHVRLLARQTIATEAMAVARGAPLPGSRDDWIALEDEILALGQSALADRRSQAPRSASLPLGEG